METWILPKKPYKLKLDSKASLLGMPAGKTWVLLANYDDKSLLRDQVAFEVGRRVGMAWTPNSRFVELFLNGQYEGNYQLTEEIKIDNNRVNIRNVHAVLVDLFLPVIAFILTVEEKFYKSGFGRGGRAGQPEGNLVTEKRACRRSWRADPRSSPSGGLSESSFKSIGLLRQDPSCVSMAPDLHCA